MGLNPHMQNLTLAKIKLKDLVERFDVIVITEKLFESLVLLARRNRFVRPLFSKYPYSDPANDRLFCNTLH